MGTELELAQPPDAVRAAARMHNTRQPRESSVVSATEPDWSREQIDPRAGRQLGKHLLGSIRQYQSWRHRRGPIARLMRKYFAMKWRLWSIITASEVPLETQIGGGLLMPHPMGIVIHRDAKIGPNCLIFHGVTLGTRSSTSGAPTIGGHVDIGCGAKLLGGIHVGDHAKIGANAVVLCDVPPGRTAVGVPAHII